MKKRQTKADKAFLNGFAIACAEVVRLHGEPQIAADVLAASGFTLAQFKAAGIDQYDLDEIQKLFETEVNLRAKGGNALSAV